MAFYVYYRGFGKKALSIYSPVNIPTHSSGESRHVNCTVSLCPNSHRQEYTVSPFFYCNIPGSAQDTWSISDQSPCTEWVWWWNLQTGVTCTHWKEHSLSFILIPHLNSREFSMILCWKNPAFSCHSLARPARTSGGRYWELLPSGERLPNWFRPLRSRFQVLNVEYFLSETSPMRYKSKL